MAGLVCTIRPVFEQAVLALIPERGRLRLPSVTGGHS